MSSQNSKVFNRFCLVDLIIQFYGFALQCSGLSAYFVYLVCGYADRNCKCFLYSLHIRETYDSIYFVHYSCVGNVNILHKLQKRFS